MLSAFIHLNAGSFICQISDIAQMFLCICSFARQSIIDCMVLDAYHRLPVLFTGYIR